MDVIIYRADDNRQPVKDYVQAARRSGDRQVTTRFDRMVEMLEQRGEQLGPPHSRIIDRTNRVHELRFGPHRVAYIVHENVAVLLCAWRKSSQKLDRREAQRAVRYAADFREAERGDS